MAALLVLASLYLPWQEASCKSAACRDALLWEFIGEQTIDGWSSQVGSAAALVALALAVVAGVAVVRGRLADRLPLGVCALLTGYFVIAVAAVTRSTARSRAELTRFSPDFDFAYGAYVGVAGGLLALLAAAVIRRDEIVFDRSRDRVLGILLAGGLLVSILLPWQEFTLAPHHASMLGIEAGPAAVLSAVSVCLAAASWSTSSAANRLRLVGAAAVLTGGAFSALTLGADRAYGAWVALGLAAALVVLALPRSATYRRVARVGRDAIGVAAGALLVVALFLPWQAVCLPTGHEFAPFAGRCLSVNGWADVTGASAGAMAIVFVAAIVAARRGRARATAELAAGIALLVATFGFALAASSDLPGTGFGFGSFIGFGAAGLLLLDALVRLRTARIEQRRLFIVLAPLGACLAYIVVVIVPFWDVLPQRLLAYVGFSLFSWLTVVGALLGIGLFGQWLRRAAGASGRVEWLVLVPLGMLALATLDLIGAREEGVSWGGGIVVGLCLLLVALGRIEQRTGLENFRVPEVLRIDRI